MRRDLDALARRDQALAEGGLAQTAVALAGKIDDPRISPNAMAQCAATLQDVLAGLWALAPAADRHDEIDELNAKRVARRAG